MRLLGIFFGIGSGILWALNNVVFAEAYQRFLAGFDAGAEGGILPALVGAAYNDLMAFAVVAIYVVTCRLLGQVTPLFAAAYLPGIIATGLLGGFTGSYCYFSAIALIGAQKALVFTALYPVVSVLLALLFLKQRLTIPMWIGCILSVAGIWILYGGMSLKDVIEVSRGVLLALGAAFCWGSEMVLASYTMRGIDATIAVLWREGISAIALWCAVFAVAPSVSIESVYAGDTSTMLYFFIGGAFAGLSYTFWYRANHYLGVARGMALNTSYILWGTLFALLLSEDVMLSWTEWAGASILFIGIVLVVLEPKSLRGKQPG
ncbi:DMT family transporter [Selenomonas sp. TAMA-11512]|uniref:DMT family transporter n=1 Tax=Selenomonas sp. TAMA-11512 TaxID=3095337 RepID=UPI00308B0CC8|nr:DMT family transporter [Selenomonas sp. TAMA-11512]